MANQIHAPAENEVMKFTASGSSYSVGDAVVIGTRVGILAVDVADGESGAAAIGGQWSVPAASPEAWAQGARVYLNAGTGDFTTTSGGNTFAGVAALAKASAATTGEVLLQPSGE